MFTGLVEGMARVTGVFDEPPGRRLAIDLAPLSSLQAEPLKIGESIALNGCCLTVVASQASCAEFQAGPETLGRTNLGRLAVGQRINVERSLKMGERLGGHFVSGHIDAQGTLVRREDAADWSTFWFEMPRALARQLAPKGSIALDGVSLTLVEVTPTQFSVALIPHTLAVTTLGQLHVGDSINLETDLLAKYVEAQLGAQPE